MIED
jgi:alpha-glucosidase (family GH31 glycosyl hydrolase)